MTSSTGQFIPACNPHGDKRTKKGKGPSETNTKTAGKAHAFPLERRFFLRAPAGANGKHSFTRNICSYSKMPGYVIKTAFGRPVIDIPVCINSLFGNPFVDTSVQTDPFWQPFYGHFCILQGRPCGVDFNAGTALQYYNNRKRRAPVQSTRLSFLCGYV